MPYTPGIQSRLEQLKRKQAEGLRQEQEAEQQRRQALLQRAERLPEVLDMGRAIGRQLIQRGIQPPMSVGHSVYRRANRFRPSRNEFTRYYGSWPIIRRIAGYASYDGGQQGGHGVVSYCRDLIIKDDADVYLLSHDGTTGAGGLAPRGFSVACIATFGGPEGLGRDDFVRPNGKPEPINAAALEEIAKYASPELIEQGLGEIVFKYGLA